MTRAQWAVLAFIGPPTLIGAAVVSATLGPLGALAYGGLLLAGVNVPHLFRHRTTDPRGRHR